MKHTITLSKLSEKTGMSLQHLSKLIERGILPPGEKIGRVRYLPLVEVRKVLKQPKHKNARWLVRYDGKQFNNGCTCWGS